MFIKFSSDSSVFVRRFGNADIGRVGGDWQILVAGISNAISKNAVSDNEPILPGNWEERSEWRSSDETQRVPEKLHQSRVDTVTPARIAKKFLVIFYLEMLFFFYKLFLSSNVHRWNKCVFIIFFSMWKFVPQQCSSELLNQKVKTEIKKKSYNIIKCTNWTKKKSQTFKTIRKFSTIEKSVVNICIVYEWKRNNEQFKKYIYYSSFLCPVCYKATQNPIMPWTNCNYIELHSCDKKKNIVNVRLNVSKARRFCS